jgi:protein transport protein SEC61 subunit alpha
MAMAPSKTMFSQALSPVTVDTGRGPEFEGAIVCLLHLLFTWANKHKAIDEAFFRQQRPNLMVVGIGILVFACMLFMKGTLVHSEMH